MVNCLGPLFAKLKPFDGHALLSPSSAHRWIRCTGSIRFTQEIKKTNPEIEDTSSKAAEEGTRAHELAEAKIIRFINEKNGVSKILDSSVEPDDEYMDQITDGYATYILDEVRKAKEQHKGHGHFIDEILGTEVPVHMDQIPTYGRTDAVYVLLTSESVHVSVFDFKYGYSRVEVKNNPQLKLYAIGVLEIIEPLLEGKEVLIDTHIYQPRVNNVGKSSIEYQELIEWYRRLKVVATAALNGTGRIHAGPHCLYCPVSQFCKDRLSYDFEVISNKLREASQLVMKEETGETLASMLDTLDGLKSTAEKLESAIKEKAIERIENGGSVPGYIKKERKGREMYEASAKAQIVLNLKEKGYLEDLSLLEPVSPGKLKKAIGSEAFTEVTQGLMKTAKPIKVIEKDKTILENSDLFD